MISALKDRVPSEIYKHCNGYIFRLGLDLLVQKSKLKDRVPSEIYKHCNGFFYNLEILNARATVDLKSKINLFYRLARGFNEGF